MFEQGAFPYHHEFGVVRAQSDRAVVDVAVLVPAGTAMTWTSVDGETGAPVAFATWVVDGRTITTTDARGVGPSNLRSTSAPVGDVGAPGFCGAKVQLRALEHSEQPIVIPFLRACSIRGRASDPSGAPLAGWWVYGGRGGPASARATDWFDVQAFTSYTLTFPEGTLTAADGSFVLDGLAAHPQPYGLCIRPEATNHETGKLVRELVISSDTVLTVRRLVPLRVRVEVHSGELPRTLRFEWLDARAPGAGWTLVREFNLNGSAFTTRVPAGTIGLRLTELGTEGRSGAVLDVDPEAVAAAGELVIGM